MILVLSLVGAVFAAVGKPVTIKSGSAEFFAIGKPSMLKIRGTASKLEGSLTTDGKSLTGSYQIPLEAFETGMKVRDEHLKEKVFEVQKHPKAKLVLSSFPLTADSKATDVPFKGMLLLHGVEKPIEGKADIEKDGALTKVVARFEMKLTDYQITPPEFMKMKIQDQVRVEVRQELATTP